MWERIVKNASWSLISLGAVALFGFGAMYFNARALGVEGLGALAGVLALSLMLEAFAGMQSWQAVLALSDGREGRVLGAALILNFATALIGVAIGWACLALIDFGLEGYALWAAAALIFSQIIRLSDPLTGVLRKFDHFGFLALVRSVTGCATFLVAIWFWSISAPLTAYLAAFALIYVANNAFLLRKVVQVCCPERPNRDEVFEVLSFCIPTGLSGAIGAIRQRGIVVLLGGIAGAGAVGFYAVADRIAALLQMLYRAMFEAVFKEMPASENRRFLVAAVAGAAFIFSCGALTAVYYLGPPVIIWVAGEAFAPSADVLTILVSAICLSLITLGLRAWVIVRIGPRVMLWCNVFALSALLAAPVLISHYGAVGAALTQIAFEALWLIAITAVLIKKAIVLDRV